MMNTRAVADQKRFVVEEHLGADLPPVNGDFSAVCQCRRNLVVNAVKYGGNHRRITIQRPAGPREGDHAEEMRISVEDHGIGIDSSELQQIFEPFYRSPAVTAARDSWHGFGVAAGEGIAEAMGGKITVVSKVG
jgi:two-component system phosphate regulon sensor histidine kinase PhoR